MPALISADARPIIVDAPSTLILRMGQGAFDYICWVQSRQVYRKEHRRTIVNILRLTVRYLNATINGTSRNVKPEFGPDRSSQTRWNPRVDGVGPGLDNQEAAVQVCGRFWNRTELFFRSKSGSLAVYPDQLVTLPETYDIEIWLHRRGSEYIWRVVWQAIQYRSRCHSGNHYTLALTPTRVTCRHYINPLLWARPPGLPKPVQENGITGIERE